MFLRITRLGKVDIVHQSDTQCWDKGWVKYKYAAFIVCHEDNMDKDGFILDNKEIKKVITEALQNHVGSCELMAKTAAQALLQAAKVHGTMVINLHVKLEPAECDPDDHTIMEYSVTGDFN